MRCDGELHLRMLIGQHRDIQRREPWSADVRVRDLRMGLQVLFESGEVPHRPDHNAVTFGAERLGIIQGRDAEADAADALVCCEVLIYESQHWFCVHKVVSSARTAAIASVRSLRARPRGIPKRIPISRMERSSKNAAMRTFRCSPGSCSIASPIR